MDRDQAQGRVTTSRDAHTQPEGVCAWQAADPYGTSILTVGQRVFGLTDWTRNGSLAQYAAVEARNLAPSQPMSTTSRPPRCRSPDSSPGRPCSTTPT